MFGRIRCSIWTIFIKAKKFAIKKTFDYFANVARCIFLFLAPHSTIFADNRRSFVVFQLPVCAAQKSVWRLYSHDEQNIKKFSRRTFARHRLQHKSDAFNLVFCIFFF